MDGWIKLHREIIDHWIYQDAEYLKVWIEMLVRARYWNDSAMELVGDQLIKVDRGEFIFGRPKWSKRLGISEQRLRTLVQKMIKDEMIEVVQKYPRCTLYRIKNYEKFNQQDNHQNNQQETQQYQGMKDDGDQQIDQQNNQRPTSSQPTVNQQPTNNKERKNVKNDKKDIIPKISFAESVALTQAEYDRLVSEFGEDITKRAIDYLSSYKAEKGYKTKSDNLTIRRWVIDAVTKQRGGAAFGKYERVNVGVARENKFASADKNKPFDPRELEELGLP